jgi:hypothetical protein
MLLRPHRFNSASTVMEKMAIRTMKLVLAVQLNGQSAYPPSSILYRLTTHMKRWTGCLKDKARPSGAIASLTLKGGSAEYVQVGDGYRLGSALLMVTQPRLPVFKLKFGRDDIIEPSWPAAARVFIFLSAKKVKSVPETGFNWSRAIPTRSALQTSIVFTAVKTRAWKCSNKPSRGRFALGLSAGACEKS